MKSEIVAWLQAARVVAVVRRLPEDVFHDVIGALIEGGVTTIEVTMDSAGGSRLIAQTRERYGDRARIGAGTVLTEQQLLDAHASGAEFFVSPHFDPALLSLAESLAKPMVPGVLSPTEVHAARQAGAEAVKIFPAAAMGPGYVRDLRGPFGDLQAMVTGGIDETNARQFIEAGAIAVGMGSSLFPKAEIAVRDFISIARRAERLRTLLG
ncbi:2-keto-3-deoxy-phosphogluconate aldolase [Alicyclobacillus hesperidum subsp. aegles]|uniref:bifunctional 4-hydroxy-2-oxoglutarate aldolase/2-dehydro-3-deoxy-phosphogluconate aldolase n=1 Tax=Alicyclobacillus hesperidum TaxID=89784 RepID=UPI00222BFC8E|nr:bifunctional 4-hydroxy-2-oxoglutarate aldolase/2-dehydro-3-deoxy-phosphogluconate aldolase [Alicyclobacillus hesperidum]GLG01415.1 2-keto-3-deoxy-phosphogluconate aldolase [Alicyclobacillus hesperidum subsp. aegles]